MCMMQQVVRCKNSLWSKYIEYAKIVNAEEIVYHALIVYDATLIADRAIVADATSKMAGATLKAAAKE